MTALSISEREAVRNRAVKATRRRLDQNKPTYHTRETGNRAGAWITNVLHYSRLAVVLTTVALLIASSIRTISAVFANYRLSNTSAPVSALAALMFVTGVELSIFTLSLAREGQAMQRRATNAPRAVLNLRDVVRFIGERLGVIAPLPYSELPDRGGLLGLLVALATGFSIITNISIAMHAELSATSLPLAQFVGSLTALPVGQQIHLLETLALAILPPIGAVVGGELTARFAAEYGEKTQAGKHEFEQAMSAWRAAYADPLANIEGEALYRELLTEKEQRKLARQTAHNHDAPERAQESEAAPFVATPANGRAS